MSYTPPCTRRSTGAGRLAKLISDEGASAALKSAHSDLAAEPSLAKESFQRKMARFNLQVIKRPPRCAARFL